MTYSNLHLTFSTLRSILLVMFLVFASSRSAPLVAQCACQTGDCIEDCEDIAANPMTSAMCPLDVTLIIDESGSIVGCCDDAIDDISAGLRDAAFNFLHSLVSSEIRVSIIEFNSTARLSLGYTTVTQASVEPGGAFYDYLYGDINTRIDAAFYDPEDYNELLGRTNWEAAFNRVADLPSPPAFVTFFTDGNPTTYCTTADCSTFSSALPLPAELCVALSRGKAAANVVKANGSRVFGLGFPNRVLSECNMQQATGLVAFDPSDLDADDILSEADFVEVNSPTQLNAAFMAIAQALTVPCDVTSTESDTVCSGTEITLTVNAAHNDPAWEYLWSPGGEMTKSITITPDETTTYSVQVTNTVTNCVLTCDLEVPIFPMLTCGESIITDETCFESDDGTLTAIAVGGVAPFTFSIASETNMDGQFTGLAAGSYQVTITDSKGCMVICEPETIGEPTALACTIVNKTDESCNEADDGTVTVSATGGTFPYTYTLGTESNETGLFTDLPTGSYTVTILDANECSVTCDEISINQPAPLTCSIIDYQDPSCHRDNGVSNGAFTVSASGGTAPYSYSIEGSGESQDDPTFTALAGGTYNVLVTDDSSCVTSCMVTLAEPPPLTCSLMVTNPSCHEENLGNNDGRIVVTAIGGTGDIMYSIDGTNFLASNEFSELSEGAYTLSVMDDSSCISTCTTTLVQPDELTAEVIPSCIEGTQLINISVTASGGTPGSPSYTYAWTGPNSFMSDQKDLMSVPEGGPYTLVITDGNQCQYTESVTQVGCCRLLTECDELTDQTYTCDDLPEDLFGDAGGSFSNECGLVTITDDFTHPGVCGGTVLVTYTLVDDLGTTDPSDDVIEECSSMVTIEAAPAPVFLDPPGNITLPCGALPSPGILGYSNDLSTENCLIEGEVASEISGSADVCGGLYTEMWTFVDECENEISYSRTITVVPAQSPVFDELPGDVEISCDEAPPTRSILSYDNDAASASCVLAGTVLGTVMGSHSVCGGSYTETWTYIDPCENEISHSRTITVTPAATASFINPPGDVEIGCTEAPPTPSMLSYSNQGVTTNCLIAGEVEGLIIGSHDACGGSYTETWTYADECENEISYSRTITVAPATTPDFVDMPGDIVIACDDIPLIDGVPSISETTLDYTNGENGLCALAGSVTSEITGEIDCCLGSTLTEIWTFEYCVAGEETQRSSLAEITHTRTITIVGDETGPEIEGCPDDMDLGCITSGPPNASLLPDPILDPAVFGASDNQTATQDLIVTHVDVGPIVDGCNYTFARTYTISDECEFSTTCTQEFVLKYDTEAPILTGIPASISIDCETDIESLPWPEVTALDACDGDLTVSRELVPGFSNCGGAFYERRFYAVDECGNRVTGGYTINLDDFDAPTLVVGPDTTLQCEALIPEPTHTVVDNCSFVEVAYEADTTYINDCEYTIVRKWTARDGCGNESSAMQTIQVRDMESPVITIVNPDMAGLEDGGEMVMFGCDQPEVLMSNIEISDDCCIDISSLVTFDNLIASNVCGVFGFNRRWRCGYTVSDMAGNEVTFTFDVLQYDTVGPVIHNLPPDLSLNCENAIVGVDTTVFATDSCSRLIDGFFTENIIAGLGDTSQAILRTWSFEDGCQNRSTATQVITVCDFDMALISSALGNTVWNDLDEDGIQDEDEPGLNQVSVNLYEVDETSGTRSMMRSTTTATMHGRSGQFDFDYLPSGAYQLEFVILDGLSPTSYQSGTDDELDSDMHIGDLMTDVIHLGAEMRLTSIDAGFISAAALPVELVDFSASALDCENTLRWETAWESGTDHFAVQHSVDGISFETVGTVATTGSQSFGAGYQLADIVRSSENYYRLKIIDLDGSFAYSKIVHVKSECNTFTGITLFPNPTTGKINVGFDYGTKLSGFLTVTDGLGRVIKEISFEGNAGRNRQEIDLSEFPPGVYTVQAYLDAFRFSELVLKK